tara:strand:- start:159 stop:278 length:120 start_codon:yes stop_codon:yes gene_type:complete
MKRKKPKKNTPTRAKGQYHGVAYPRTDGKNDGKRYSRRS